MTTEVIETERGRVLLLPDDVTLPPGPVDLLQAGPNRILVSADFWRNDEKTEGYFDGPYEDNGLVAPEDFPPEPVSPC